MEEEVINSGKKFESSMRLGGLGLLGGAGAGGAGNGGDEEADGFPNDETQYLLERSELVPLVLCLITKNS